MKRWVYWLAYIIFMAGGFCVSWFRWLPIENTAVFVAGILWFWNCVLFFLGKYPDDGHEYPRVYELINSAAFLVMGVVWVWISMTPMSDQFLPMLAVSVPSLLAIGVVDVWFRSQTKNNKEKE